MSKQKEPKIWDIVRDSLKIIGTNWKIFLIYAFLGFLPILFEYLFLNSKNLYNLAFMFIKAGSLANYIIPIITALVYILFILFAYIIICVVDDSYKKRKVNYDEYFHKLKENWLWFITTALLYTILLTGGTILFVIPGIIVAVIYVFFRQAVVLKNKRHMKALDYSEKLVKGRGWTVFLILVVFTLFSIPLSIPTSAYFYVAHNVVTTLSFVNDIFSLIVGIFAICFWTVYFIRLDNLSGGGKNK